MPAIEAMLTIAPRRAADHRPGERNAGDIGAPLVDAHDVVPHAHGEVGGPIGRLDDAGAVDQDLDRAELGLDACGDGGEGRLVGHVAGERGRAGDVASNRLRLRQVAIDHRDRRAAARQLDAAGRADAAGATGDDGHSGQLPLFRHCALLLKPGRRAPAGCATSRR